MQAAKWGRGLVWGSLLVVVFAWGCRRENPSSFDRNLPPETYISQAPAESTLAFYQVHLFWNGADPDGLVDFYEYSVTDSNKVPGEDTPDFAGFFKTSASDSVFRLKADRPQILGHRFYVRAVDNEGKADPTPAWTYFVAHDFNFPGVTFLRGVGTWTDKFGNEWAVDLFSSDRFNPKDTIGLGGCVEYAWTGFDDDVGGEVLGYEFRTQGDIAFRGGTLADTTFGRCFEGDFSGDEALFVRAIDDAGAKTLPDSVRSVVVNFNPITWVVDPLQPEIPTPLRVFTESGGRIFPSGTTLALRSEGGGRSITFAYTAIDDPRDFSDDPENPGVIGYSFRKLVGTGGQAFRDIPTNQWEPYPAINLFSQLEANNLGSGDFQFLIRARDSFGRWGSPDTISVGVNYPAFFAEVNYFDSQGALRPLWDPDGGPVTVDIPAGGGSPAPMQVVFQAVDQHSADNPDPRELREVVEDEVGSVDEYRVRINGSTSGFEAVPPASGGVDERFLPVGTNPDTSQVVRPGDNNTLTLEARDNGGRKTQLVVNFRVNIIE